MKRYFGTYSRLQFLSRFQKHVANTAPKEHVVKELVRPLGLPEPPTMSSKYKEGNSFRDLFDNAKTDRRARELELEFSKGGLFDMYTFRKTQGKMFLSPPSFWRKDKALYFPHLQGRSLSSSDTQNVEDLSLIHI